MGHAAFLVRSGFNKIFCNIAKSLNTEPSNIQICICWANKSGQFDIYKDLKKEIDNADLDNYIGGLDWGGSIGVIQTFAFPSGVRYAQELKCPIESIEIVLGYKKGELPMCVLLKDKQKVRTININEEFLSGS